MPQCLKALFVNRPLKIAVVLFMVGLLTATLAAQQQRINNQEALQKLFEEEVKTAVDSIIAHINTYNHALLGIRGLIVAHGDDSITRKAFHTYTLSRNLDIEYSSALGFGFIRKVARADEANFLTKARKDTMPNFAIKDFTPHEGDHYIIQYIEPADRNRAATGLDIASEEMRRTAAIQAMRNGTTTITAPITLAQASGLSLRSFLILLPVYHLTMPLDNAELREAATFGWAYAPIVIDDILTQSGITNEQLAFQVADVGFDKQANGFYSSPEFEETANTQNTTKITRVIFGRQWQFTLRAQPLFYQYHQQLLPLWIANLIAFCALILSVFVYLYLSYQQRKARYLIEQAQLAAIVESANDAIIGFDLTGVVTSWNNAADRLFDYSPTEAIGKKVYDLITPDEFLPEIEPFLRRMRRGELVGRSNTIRKTRTGKIIDVAVSYSLIYDNKGTIIGVANTITDITEQKRSEDLFRLTIEAIPDAIVTVNHENIITLLNQKAIDLFGYKKSELLGQNISFLMPDHYRQQYFQADANFNTPLMNLPLWSGEQNLSVLRKDGNEIPVEIQLSPIQSATEHFTLTTITDIRTRKNLETEVQTTLARMKMAITSLNVGIWVWRLADNTLLWDEQMFTLYHAPENLKETQLYYDFWVSSLHADDREESESLLMGAVAGKNSFDTEFRIVLDNGKIRHIRAAAILERDATGTPIQMVGVNQDITTIKTAAQKIKQLDEQRTTELQSLNASLEQQVDNRTTELNLTMEIAKQANAAKTNFLATMTHEIRTPMNAIIGLAYLLQKESLSPDVRDMVKKIDGAGRSLLAIINECLDFSKIEANLLEIESITFSLPELLNNVATIMTTLVAEKPIKAQILPLQKDLDYLIGDPVRLEQVLLNLISNAVKFTEKGEIIVEIRVIDSISTGNHIHLHFSVRDTGIGIALEKQESIFHPFIQADNSTSRLYGGTGLGLSICRNLVQLMGGILQLKSEVGVGSEFFFELMLAVSKPNGNSASISFNQNALIVDNDAPTSRVSQSILQDLGWSSTAVDSVENALLAMTKGKDYFDFLLLDCQLLEGDSIQLVTNIQEQLGKGHGSIIIMSPNQDEGHSLLKQFSGIAGSVVSKPVTHLSLFKAILETKKKRGELDKQLISGERLAGLNLLIVDDSDINRNVAYQILTGERANVECTDNGREAIALLIARPNYFHAVLMDVQMPIMDGYTATREIRTLPELNGLPIIALTAGAFKTYRTAALEAGMDDFIAKPFDVDELVACVERHVCQSIQRKPSNTLPILQSPTIAIDTMPLIDVEHGLKKWRDVTLYKECLRLFLQQHGDDADCFYDKLLDDNPAAAKAITHKLLSAAGALSLKRITHLLKEIEDTFSNDGDVNSLSSRFAPLLSETMDAIHVYLDAEIVAETKQTNVEND
ncbi:MAG: PAS domain S-box protein [Methylococcales bacterium]|nr:PAS domain S-box protein [Methylococcales bacterium]